MTHDELLELMRSTPYWVQASVAPDGAPQAAVIGAVVGDGLDLFFDTLTTSRKLQNLRRERRIALVMWSAERTVQYEGVAHEPAGEELALWKKRYFARFPDGVERERSPEIAYVHVQPTWVRLSDFGGEPPRVFEWSAHELRALTEG